MINLDVIKTLNDASGEMRLDIKLEIEEGSFVTLYGKSGAGKTSVLRMLAGLMTPDAGNIKNGEVTWHNPEIQSLLYGLEAGGGLTFENYTK
ncbi:MAG: ATP-binding cassette domain-containing protein [Bacteroidota bacterium]